MPSSSKSFTGFVFLPILVLDALLSPLWFVPGYPAAHSWLPLSLLLVSGFIFPFYLAVLGSVYVWRSYRRFAASMFVLLAVASLFGVFLYYAIWGASTRLFWHPDIESVALMEFLAFSALLITLLPVSVAFLIRRWHSPRATAQA